MEGQACGCLVCGVVTLLALALSIAMIADSVHTIDEGNVGIYYVRGALQDKTSQPGVNTKVPFSTVVKQISTRPNTRTLDNVSLVTKDGLSIVFHSIQVITLVHTDKVIQLVKKFGVEFSKPLVYDRIKERLRTYCANQTIDDVYVTRFLDIVSEVKPRVQDDINRLMENNSISILSLVIPKPDIPADIEENYKKVKVQWTEQLVAEQQQKTEKIKKETESIKAVLDAEREKKVLEIEIQKDLLQIEGERNVSSLNNAITKEKEENQARIERYKKEQEAEGNSKLHSPEYVRLEMGKALSHNTKLYFSGESSALGAIFSKILGPKDESNI